MHWPAIPGCLADPGVPTQGKTDYDSPTCALYDRLLASGETDVELRSARRLNAEMDGVLYPAFLPGTEVVTFIVTGKFLESFTGATELVRVSSSRIGAGKGSWWTTLSTVTDSGHLMTAGQVRARLALLSTPTCVAYAQSIRSGVRGYMGVVAPAFDEARAAESSLSLPPDAVVTSKFEDLPGSPGAGNETVRCATAANV